MRSRTIIAILATCALGLPTLAAEMSVSPYAGQQARQIKALSVRISRRSVKAKAWVWRRRPNLTAIPARPTCLASQRSLGLLRISTSK
jgi:hypothetical protein